MTHTNWFDANPRKAKWLVALICLVLVELSIRALVGLDLLPYWNYQTDMTPRYWANIDPVVGRWRWPNTTFRHREKCIDAVYSTNSIGARDPERALSANGAERTVMIGDSVLEGFGDLPSPSPLISCKRHQEHCVYSPISICPPIF